MEKIYIYVLLDPTTDAVRYVGKTNNVYKRYYNHLQELQDPKKRGYHSKNWIRQVLKTGVAPKILIVEECNSDTWREREKFWIQLYKTEGCNLTNMTEGGDGIAGYSKPSPFKMKVDVYKVTGEFIQTFDSMGEAEIYTKVHNGKIGAICKQQVGRKSGKGFVFRYHGEPFSYEIADRSEAKDFMKKPIYEIDEDANILKTFSHALAAAGKDLDLRSAIAHACVNPFCKASPNKPISEMRLRKVKGRYFCYIENYEDIVQSLKKFRSEATNQATENTSEQ